MSLSEAFLAASPPEWRPAAQAVPDLEGLLRALMEDGRAAWPGVVVAPGELMRHLAAHLPAPGDLARVLAAVRGADLYLACACTRSDPAAIAVFEPLLRRAAVEAFRRVGLTGDGAEEALQILRERLLVGGGAPKIGSYSGRGALVAWLRVVARRLALENQRPAPPAYEADLVEALKSDPEIGLVREELRAPVRQAVRDAIEALSAKERRLLRLHHLDGLTIDQIAAMFRAQRSTAAYWISQARKHLADRTRELLAERLQISAGELNSLVRTVLSHVELSFARLRE